MDDEDEDAPTAPMVLLARRLLDALKRDDLIELEDESEVAQLVDDLAELLAAKTTSRSVGSELSEWLLERDEVVEVFASDEQLAAAVASAAADGTAR